MRKATHPNDILCPLCLDNLTSPRSLPCLHTYCERCLGDHIRNSFTKVGNASKFKCPTCENETLLPSSRRPVDGWAVYFPYDRILMSMLPGDEDKVNQLCESCRKGGKQEPADSFCTNCRKALCINCVGIHNNGKQNHSFINITDPNCRADMAIGISEKVKCTRHIHRDLDYFCRSHEQICCSDCLFDDHGTCKEKLKLRKHSSVLLKSKKTEHLNKHINELADYLDTRTQINRSAISKIESETKSMVDEIDSLISLLQNTKRRIIKEREELLERESLILHENNMHFRSLKASLINSLKSYEEVCKYGDNYECFVILHKLENQVVHCEKILQNKYSAVRQVNSNLQFLNHPDALRTIDLSQVAKVSVTETIQPAPPVPRIARSSPVQLTKVGKLQPEVGMFRTMLLWLQAPFGPKTLNVIERLPGNKMMLMGTKDTTDFGYVFHLQTNRVLGHYSLPSPWDLCIIDMDVPLVAVTIPYLSNIIIVSIECTLNETATIRTLTVLNTKPRTFYGVSSLSPSHLAVSAQCGDNVVLSIFRIVSVAELRLVREYHVCEQRRSWFFPTRGSYVATSQDKSRAYISCGAGSSDPKPAVYCLSVADGEFIFKYQHPDLTYPSKLCVDRQDNIYICNSKDPGSIHQVTGEGELIQVFHSGIPKEPISICFDEKEKELFVASTWEGEITRFRLEQ